MPLLSQFFSHARFVLTHIDENFGRLYSPAGIFLLLWNILFLFGNAEIILPFFGGKPTFFVESHEGYATNSGIIFLNIAASLLDMSIIASQVIVHFKGNSERKRIFLLFALIGGALLPWAELWYGSTFAYPNRDKQGLPFGVNNAGIVGAFVFLSYILLHFRLEISNKWVRFAIKFVFLLLLWFLMQGILYFAKDSWILRQS